jgi:hypothetical protein
VLAASIILLTSQQALNYKAQKLRRQPCSNFFMFSSFRLVLHIARFSMPSCQTFFADEKPASYLLQIFHLSTILKATRLNFTPLLLDAMIHTWNIFKA